jgi:hypothetical protein
MKVQVFVRFQIFNTSHALIDKPELVTCQFGNLVLHNVGLQNKCACPVASQIWQLHWLWLHKGNASSSDCRLLRRWRQILGVENLKVIGAWEQCGKMAGNAAHGFRLSTKHAKLLLARDKCLSFGEDFVAIRQSSSLIKAQLFWLEFKSKEQTYAHCNAFL